MREPQPALNTSVPHDGHSHLRVLCFVRPIVIGLIFGFWSAASPSTVLAGWDTYQGNARHDGYVPSSLDPTAFHMVWEKNIGGTLNSIAAADGKVFVSQDSYFAGGGLFALNAKDGNTLWNTTFGRVVSINAPAYANGTVYIQTGKDSPSPPPYLSAFNASTGDPVFRTQFSAQWESYLAPTPFQGSIYMNGGYYGGAYSINATNGGQNWFAGLPQYDQWTPAVDEQFVYAYLGDYSPGLYVMNRTTGSLAFTISDPKFDWNGWSMHEAPVIGSSNDILAIHDGRLIKFDLTAHNIQWEVDRSFQGQLSLANGVIYANDGGTLEAWSETTGQLLWSWFPPGDSITGNIVVTDSHVFTTTSSHIFAIDLASHHATWKQSGTGDLALNDGILYVVNGGSITAFQVPEPSTFVLGLAGLAGLGTLALWKKICHA